MKLHYYYDREADVLYFSEGKPQARAKTVETEDDVILRLHPKTGKVTGFTILNFVARSKHKGETISLPIEARLSAA